MLEILFDYELATQATFWFIAGQCVLLFFLVTLFIWVLDKVSGFTVNIIRSFYDSADFKRKVNEIIDQRENELMETLELREISDK